ncbi:MAG: hypothetical protein WCQ53_07215 [bacterium]
MLSKCDGRVFCNFLKKLPPNCSAINSLKNGSFVPEYPSDTFYRLGIYISESNKTTNKFINKALENKRKRFIKYAGQFITLMRNSFFPHQYRVDSLHLNQDLKHTNPKKYSDLSKRLERMGEVVYKAYDAFVTLARKEQAKQPEKNSTIGSEKIPQCTTKQKKPIKWDSVSIKILDSGTNVEINVIGQGTKNYNLETFGLAYKRTDKEKVKASVFDKIAECKGFLTDKNSFSIIDNIQQIKRSSATKKSQVYEHESTEWRSFTKQVQTLNKMIKDRIEEDFDVKLGDNGIVYSQKEKQYKTRFKIGKVDILNRK